ncbi:hypothetical protein JYG34_16480 [Pseudomonas entomophila]|uniref:NEL-type E3 ubiquitin ligase domain-containing protein n=1 Tax=Pseudomonas entomophila TaxID=312306 RepID=UPI001BCD7EAE|nr:NEL-type E3 ubiquitin ligase domain-containing protein [Pseudomonas entomophila]QVM89617.1 hypothetical protein JYG34_16480 [Pseudomonas entomophila]
MTGLDATRRLGAAELPLLAQAYQDNLIASRQPSWFKALTVEQLNELCEAMKSSLRARRLIQARLRTIQRVDNFVVPRMQDALQRYGIRLDVRSMRFEQGVFKPVTSWGPNRVPIHEVEYRSIPLMEAVLWNFTAAEAVEGGQRQGNCLVDQQGKEVRTISAIEFARLCRELDLGAQYQNHLSDVLQSTWHSDGEQLRVASLLEQSLKADMLMDAYKAHYHGKQLTEPEFELIAEFCRTGKLGTLEGDEVKARQLELLGCRLEQIVVLDVLRDGLLFGKNRKRVLVYIPGDPHGPWRAFDSLAVFARRGPGRHLRQSEYQTFFERFVPLGQRSAFFTQVNALLGDLAEWATRDLNEHAVDYPPSLFQHLAMARNRQVMADAAVLVSPVADLDSRLRQDHHQRLASDGWLLLGLAGLFVPAIALGLLAVLAWEMLSEVFEGIDDWYDGDTHEAANHFFEVGKRAAEVAAMAAGGTLVARLQPGSKLVDGMVAAQLEDGSQKLWTMNLAPFRVARPSAEAQRDAQGIYHLNNEQWVDMDGHHYPVQQTTGHQWQICPQSGHGPRLSGSATGTWRLQCDDPAGWSDTHRMFRRLGEPFRQLDDEQIETVLAIHGLRTDHLREWHVRGEGPPADLLDTVVRVQLAERVRELSNRLRLGVPVEDTEVLKAAQALPGAKGVSGPALGSLAQRQRRSLLGALYQTWSAGQVGNSEKLIRVFPSLSPPTAASLVRLASTADRERFLATGRVPLHLAESARRTSLHVRAIRVHEAFSIDAPQSADLARVALGMLKHVANAPNLHWRLLEGSSEGPVLFDSQGSGERFELVHADGKFGLYHGAEAKGMFGELFAVITGAFDDGQRSSMALGEPFPSRLQARIGEEVALRRREVERLLSPARQGTLAALQRLDEQRVGFPLSGRGAIRALGPSALYPEVRRIYPHFDVDEIMQWLDGLARDRLNVWEELSRLRQQLGQLEDALRRWLGENLQDSASRLARAQIMKRLLEAWRRIPTPEGTIEKVAFTGLQPGRLPDLPAGIVFTNVTELSFRGMGLARVPPGFFDAFPNLRILRLTGNQLTRLPNQLALRYLTVLDLYNNRIVLDAGQATVLASCENLEVINLAHNPLGRSFSVSGMNRLRKLRLNSTQIDTVPNGLEDCTLLEMADLRDNRIARLPQELMSLPVWTGRTIRVEGNPLDDAQLTRLHSVAQGEDAAELVAERWATAAPTEVRQRLVHLWAQLEAYDRSIGVMLLLRQLQQTAGFRRQPRALANRVYRILEKMQDNPGLREELFEHVDDGLTCQDGHLWRFSMLEVRMKAWGVAEAAGAGEAQTALLRFGRRQLRLYMVEEQVMQRIPAWMQANRNVDPLEVVLGYQLALREHLELPIEADEMAYSHDALLDARRIGRIRDEVLQREAEKGQEGLAEWLVDQPFWSEYMDKAYPGKFEELDAVYYRKLESAEEGESPESIQTARQQARRQLMIDLTVSAMDIPPGGAELML